MSAVQQPHKRIPEPVTMAVQPLPGYVDDEISITELALILWRNRNMAILTAVLTTVMAIAYAVLATPTYKATSYFLPPLERDIYELNQLTRFERMQVDNGKERQEIKYTSQSVLGEFLKNLNSLQIRQDFFQEQGLLSYYVDKPGEFGSIEEMMVFEEQFNEKLVLNIPKGSAVHSASIAFELDDAEEAASLLNLFVNKVSKKTIDDLIANSVGEIGAKISMLDRKITSRRELAQKRREDQVIQLQEALSIARKLGIKNPTEYSFDLQRAKRKDAVSINTANLPLYTRGTDALAAELSALRKRKGDDPFVDGLRDLQEQLSTLQAIKIDPAKVKVVTVDRPAIVPYQKEKPNRKLIVLVGLLLGVFLGAVIAFMVEFIKNFRRQLATQLK